MQRIRAHWTETTNSVGYRFVIKSETGATLALRGQAFIPDLTTLVSLVVLAVMRGVFDTEVLEPCRSFTGS